MLAVSKQLPFAAREAGLTLLLSLVPGSILATPAGR